MLEENNKQKEEKEKDNKIAHIDKIDLRDKLFLEYQKIKNKKNNLVKDIQKNVKILKKNRDSF